MPSIKDLNPDTQVSILLAAKMINEDPQLFLQWLLDSNRGIIFGFNGTTAWGTERNNLDEEKHRIITDIVQFGSGSLDEIRCYDRSSFDNGRCGDVVNGARCLFRSNRYKEGKLGCGIYSRQVKMSDVTVRAGDIAFLFGPAEQSQPKEANRSRQNDFEVFPFANNNHPCFSIELHAAVLCWQALYGAGTKECLKNRKANIREWLKNNCKDLKGEAIERVATIVNPNRLKKGGATPIS